MLIYPCLDKVHSITELLNIPILELIDLKNSLYRNNEREAAAFWYDTQESKIKDKLTKSWSEDIGGKSYTFKPVNQNFFEKELRKDYFGEDEQGNPGSDFNPGSFTQTNSVTDAYYELLQKNQAENTI